MKKILILTADPKNTNRLRLSEEVREIQLALEQSNSRGQFEIVTRWAVRVDDLQPILMDHSPQIVHFSGHGGGSRGLALENELGQMQLISSEALTGLFKLFKTDVECVFLNACYSEIQADAIHQHISCVLGMNQAIGDKAAIKFAKGFYQAISRGKSYESAFEFGCNAIDLQGIAEASVPVLRFQAEELSTQVDELPHQQAVPNQNQESFQHDVYISYVDQEPDSTWVWDTLLPRLEKANFRVAVSGDVDKPGVARVVNMEKGIKKSKRTIIILSDAYLASYSATFENILSQSIGIQEGTYRLLPIKCFSFDSSQLPTRLSMLTTLDLAHPRRAEREFERLIHSLREPLPQL